MKAVTTTAQFLEPLGIRGCRPFRDLPVAVLVEEAIQRKEGFLSDTGALVCTTGRRTGRSPNDKFYVRDQTTDRVVDWGAVNRAMSREQAALLTGDLANHLQGKDVFVEDCFVGADPETQIGVRVVAEQAWHALFARNMFIRRGPSETEEVRPDFTVLHAPAFKADPVRHGTTSDAFVVIDFGAKLVLIGGTAYAGEIKKALFSVMNFLLPPKKVLPMHCAANVGRNGDVAILFGLSGTGKTTLSADPERSLVGDDEHGWSAEGVFNLEGGCYAKAIRLKAGAEPEIYAATRRFGTILENVVVDPTTRRCDLDSERLTENTRVSYPIDAIPHAVSSGRAGHPRDVVFLTCDAFGVFPPISRLTPGQAAYHFLSGYTAKVAGTEVGVSEPQATFSACFGAAFMPLHPAVYSKLLAEKLELHKVRTWLVNTGWTGGGYGTGRRFEIAHTRTIVRAALAGVLDDAAYARDPVFGVDVPLAIPDVPPSILNQKKTWADGKGFDRQARRLAEMFVKNFAPFAASVGDEVRSAGPNAS